MPQQPSAPPPSSSVAAVRPWTQSPSSQPGAHSVEHPPAVPSEPASRSASRGPGVQTSATPLPSVGPIDPLQPIPALKDEGVPPEGDGVASSSPAAPRKESVLTRATTLQKSAAGMRLELTELRDSIKQILDEGFKAQVAIVTERVMRLTPVFSEASLQRTRHAVSVLRQQKECLSATVRALQQDVTRTVSSASAQLQAWSKQTTTSTAAGGAPWVNRAEQRAIHDLHSSIQAVITESGLGPHLAHDHQRLVNDVARQARNDDPTEQPTLSPSHQAAMKSAVPPGVVRDVDDTTVPPPEDVSAAMFGPRPWNRHVPTLLEAMPYAVAALRAIAYAIQTNHTSREMLHLRIARQERVIEDLTKSLSTLTDTVQNHITTTYKAVARVANGLVLGQYVPASTASEDDFSAKLQGLTNVVERFIEHLAWVAHRHATAGHRAVPLTVGAGGLTSPADDFDHRRAALFPASAKAGAVAGELALLRHRYYAARLRAAVQTWRFRRCALGLVAGHSSRSAKQATEEAALALATASAEIATSAAEGSKDATVEGHPEGGLVVAPAALEPVLPFWKAEKRLQATGLLPAPGAETLAKPLKRDNEGLDASFMKRSQEAIESWRVRKAREALLKFKEQQAARAGGQSPHEPLSRTLMSMEGGNEVSPTIFSALPATPANPRYQRQTHVSATKQRLRPISQPGSSRYQALTPRPPTTTSLTVGKPSSSAVAEAPMRDVLDTFLRSANGRPAL